jgi:gamma-glutamyl hercynylcysteine S-oxide synthase
MRSRIICLVILAVCCSGAGLSQDTRFGPRGQQLQAPDCSTMRATWEGPWSGCPPEAHKEWLADVTRWKFERLIRVGYDGSRYDLPALRWTQSSFIQPQMMVHDRYFFDPDSNRYTVDRYLDDLERRYGGIDAVLIWPTYPNMGIDDRNQHDMIRSMPGGISGVRKMVRDFHRRGVKVLFPMMMWDQGTRDVGMPWPQAIAKLMASIEADGINGDTQDGVPLAFSSAADKAGHPLVFEPEGGPSDEALAYNLMTWGQYTYPFVPLVDKYKWLEPRHMVNISDRWNRVKTNNLQFAFFNGIGWESWENIWGIWNGITPRDGEATRRMSAIEREVAPFLVSSGWEPYAPTMQYGVFASRWPLKDATVWTIVNRNPYNTYGPQLPLPVRQGMHYYDLYHGVELTPRVSGDTLVLGFEIEENGIGAIMARVTAPDSSLRTFLARMSGMTARPLVEYSDKWKVLPQHVVEVPRTTIPIAAPRGMIRIPGVEYFFKVRGIEIEGTNDEGVDVQYPWEDSPRRFHQHFMQIKSFWIDSLPVTNKQYKEFLEASKYQPKDTINYLRNWRKGTFAAGAANKPVTWISLEDARAYVSWAGKRLPHEWEWQYAAQGTTNRVYPWGNRWDSTVVPVPDRGRVMREPDSVSAHPAGASPFGVLDMVGNIWQWTDEYVDEHTRAAVLRGGSYYQPQGSLWYFPQAYRLDEHGKLLLMAPGYDRSGTVGFRCVMDAE